MKTKKSIRFIQYSVFIAAVMALLSKCGPAAYEIETFCEKLEEYIEVLSSDEFEGRAPSTPGGRKTVEYIESHFRRIGLEPAVNGSYRQTVPLVEITPSNISDLRITGNGADLSFRYYDEMMVNSVRLGMDDVNLSNSEMVFVGYGVNAPEYDWNDYEGVDVSGKTVVILVNDPGYATGDEELFTGNAMTYYGRWTYKFEEAARQGAEAALIIHQSGPAGYGWNVVSTSWSGPNLELDAEREVTPLLVEGWIQKDVAEKIFEQAGTSLSELSEMAISPDFTPVPLDLTTSVSFSNSYRTSESHNVIGYIEGSMYPEESFVYMAHWDHLGMTETEEGEIEIYNGAVDNATGTAGVICLAERFMALEEPPQRTIVFMAVTAEESGLLGSRYYAENPLFPLSTTVAGINMDALNVYGPTHDVSVIGYGSSDLDNYLRRHASAQNRRLEPDEHPERGYYYRSDHFSMARFGVPMIYAKGGSDYIGRDEEYSQMVAEDYAKRYHMPEDVMHDLWDFEGLHQDLWLFFNIGKDLANSNDFPNWVEGNEFRAIRDKTEAARRR